MTALIMTLSIGFLVMIAIIIALFLSIKNGQYDDMDGTANRILFDDHDPKIPPNDKPSTKSN